MSWSSAARRAAIRSDSSSRRELAAFLERGEGAPSEVVGAEGVLEAGVGGAGVDQEGMAELPDIAQPLHRRGIENVQRRRVKPDVVPERVADDFVVGHDDCRLKIVRLKIERMNHILIRSAIFNLQSSI